MFSSICEKCGAHLEDFERVLETEDEYDYFVGLQDAGMIDIRMYRDIGRDENDPRALLTYRKREHIP